MNIQSASVQLINIDRSYLWVKRALDIPLTLLILPILAIVGAMVAIAIPLDSKGPILFRQRRVGKNG